MQVIFRFINFAELNKKELIKSFVVIVPLRQPLILLVINGC